MSTEPLFTQSEQQVLKRLREYRKPKPTNDWDDLTAISIVRLFITKSHGNETLQSIIDSSPTSEIVQQLDDIVEECRNAALKQDWIFLDKTTFPPEYPSSQIAALNNTIKKQILNAIIDKTDIRWTNIMSYGDKELMAIYCDLCNS